MVADKAKENESMQIDINISLLTHSEFYQAQFVDHQRCTWLKCTDSNAGILLSDIVDTDVLNNI